MADIVLFGQMGERGNGSFLFWWKGKMPPDRDIGAAAWEKPNELSVAFSYGEHSGGAECFPPYLLGSIIAHDPYWERPTAKFSEDELLRIEAMAEETGTVWDGDAHPVYGPIPAGAA